MLVADRVTKRFARVVALDDVSLTVAEGACLALVGESGSGKSTLLRCFNALVVPDVGGVRVGGRAVAELDPVALRRSIGYVQQEGGLLPHWTIARNAALVPALRGMPDAAGRGRAALARVGLEPARFADRYPAELSGGQRQRAALARALAADPAVLLLDEPFGALDALTRADAQRLLEELRAEQRLTTLLVTHDLREAMRLADLVAVLRGGRVEGVAPPAALLAAPPTAYAAELLARAGLRR